VARGIAWKKHPKLRDVIYEGPPLEKQTDTRNYLICWTPTCKGVINSYCFERFSFLSFLHIRRKSLVSYLLKRTEENEVTIQKESDFKSKTNFKIMIACQWEPLLSKSIYHTRRALTECQQILQFGSPTF